MTKLNNIVQLTLTWIILLFMPVFLTIHYTIHNFSYQELEKLFTLWIVCGILLIWFALLQPELIRLLKTLTNKL